jgi:hypothetical protein
MYSFVEIDLIFKNCLNKEECYQARKAFAMVFEDQDLNTKKIFFIRKKQRIRENQLK